MELPELTQDWGNRLLEHTNKTLCTPGPRRKEQWPYKRLTQTRPWVFRSLQRRCGSVVACCRVGGTECSSACMGPFEGGQHYLHYLHHSLASSQTTGSERSPTHQQKIRLKIYWAWPHPSEKNSVSPSVSLCHQEASKSLLSFSIRGQTEWKPQSQKTTNLITWTTALSNSMKLWAIPCRATKDKLVMVESSGKMGSTGEGMADYFSILALRTPWTVWKGKMIGHWKMNSPGQ